MHSMRTTEGIHSLSAYSAPASSSTSLLVFHGLGAFAGDLHSSKWTSMLTWGRVEGLGCWVGQSGRCIARRGGLF